VLKSLLAFVHPRLGLRSMERVSRENARRMFVPAGMLLAGVGGLLVYHLLRSG
jgi:hypothetical protein